MCVPVAPGTREGGQGLGLSPTPTIISKVNKIRKQELKQKNPAELINEAEKLGIENPSTYLRELDDIFNGRVRTVYSTTDAIAQYSAQADLVVGAVLIPGAAAPKLLTREHIANMKKGAVVVDVAIDHSGDQSPPNDQE